MDYRDLPEGASNNPLAPYNQKDNATRERDCGYVSVEHLRALDGGLTQEQRDAQRDAALKALEASCPSLRSPASYAAALVEYQRRQKQSLAEWLAENMKEQHAKA